MRPVVWLSRQTHRAQALAAELTASGLTPLLQPALSIQKLNTPSFTAYLKNPARHALSIIISPEAAAQLTRALSPHGGSAEGAATTATNAVPALPPAALPALAIGAATAAALPPCYALQSAAYKTETTAGKEPPDDCSDNSSDSDNSPDNPGEIGDSERLLSLPLLASRLGSIALIGGASVQTPSPAPALAAALVARGNTVTPVICYRRAPAAPNAALSAKGRAGQIHAAVAYSTETLDGMLAMTAPHNGWLKALPLYVIHRNIAAAAAARGFHNITTTPAIAAAITAHLRALLS